MRKILIAATAMLLAFPLSARADEASKRAKIEQMLTVLKMEDNFNLLMKQVEQQGRQMGMSMTNPSQLTEADKKILDNFMTKLMAAMQETMGWQKLKSEFIDLYAKAYTEEEVDGILTFYKSPVGQSMLAKTPQLVQQSMAISQTHMKEIQPKLEQLTEELKKDLDAAHAAKPKS
ncbi:DUF2059 domain-containing protein [Terriglobus albidus]|uniref:DUF2059 domain-containing protein n=1 Tax=Terriglobus albidus TaxID=1592106 RepID=A0A5B9E9A0_9BACT|nr:DUF2059 domain-containing protein [Terriglobus albidus]QEE27715.1 DUF2059 domain-containing protein [Terriglobus albidus]